MDRPKIALITDSTSDLAPDVLHREGISIVPLYILWGKDQFRDRIDIQPGEFYARLEVDALRPKTSQPTPNDFLTAYEKAEQEGAEAIVVLPISDGVSGTSQAARQAAQQARIPVSVAVTKGTTMSLGWQVLAAARERNGSGTVKAILAAAERVRQKIVLLVTLDTIEFLASGGRIGNAAKLINSILNIKPQVWLNHETGKVELGDITRTRLKALESLYQGFIRRVGAGHHLRVAVWYNAAVEEARALFDRLKTELHPDELVISDGSPVLGVHTGPRALALSGYMEDEEE